jgi:type I restriction enzyme S subunit
MLKYSTYKSSGVECLGDIPEHWDVKRLKDFAKVENGRDYKDVEVDEGGFPVYGSGGEFRRSSQFIFDKPSVLLGRKGTIDKPLLVTKPFWTVDTMFYTDIKPNVDYRFFYYLCKTIQFDMYTYGSALPSMTQQTLHTINFSRPPLIDQTAIANYLDEKTGKLDLLISNKKKQIKRLKEIRQIEIYTAVTKGLDPNVKRKPTGVEWLGDIPEHWEIKKLKRLVSVQKGSLPKNLKQNKEENFFPYLSMATLRGSEPTEFAYFNDGIYVEQGSLGILWDGSKSGEILKFNQAGIVSSTVAALKIKTNDLYYHYLYYTLKYLEFDIQNNTNGMGIPHVDGTYLKYSNLLIPSKQEQSAISNYLDEKTSKIDQLVSNLENQINQLQEIRKIEIYSAVTGKIKVA